jgi:hypothetical protein
MGQFEVALERLCPSFRSSVGSLMHNAIAWGKMTFPSELFPECEAHPDDDPS